MTYRANSPWSIGCCSLRSQSRPLEQKLIAYFLVSEGWKHTWGTHVDRAGLLKWKARGWTGVGEMHIFLCTALLVTEPARKPFVLPLGRLYHHIFLIRQHRSPLKLLCGCWTTYSNHAGLFLATGTGLFCCHPLGHAAFLHFGRLKCKGKGNVDNICASYKSCLTWL